METTDRTIQRLYDKIDNLQEDNSRLYDFINEQHIKLEGLSAITYGLAFNKDENLIDIKALLSAIGFVSNSLFHISKELENI